MKNLIEKLEIKNFKTAKSINVNCKRINIIIGKPNVGKSNILEAISLLGAVYSQDKKYLSEFIRYERFEDLFYDKETANPVSVVTNIGRCEINHEYRLDNYAFNIAPNASALKELKESQNSSQYLEKWYELNHKRQSAFSSLIAPYNCNVLDDGQQLKVVHINQWNSPVKKYDFKKGIVFKDRFHHFLSPPFGKNLFAIVNTSKGLFKEISNFFKEYRLDFVMDTKASKFALQKKVNGVIYTYDYNLIADTLQRYIFNLMAIASNKESVLLFEEPEAHLYPPYAKEFAQKVIDSKSNQFFVATHSPFILNTIIENAPTNEVAVFVATYEKFQTKLKALSQAELEDMLNYGNDIFFSKKLNG